jgi:thioesterase domain-containing protein
MNKIIAADLDLAERAGARTSPAPARFPTLAAALEFTAAAWAAGLRGKLPDPDTEYWKLGINVNRALDIVRDFWFRGGIDLPLNLFVEAPTIRKMAARLHDGSALHPLELLHLRDGDASAPLFLFAGGTGLLMEYTDFVGSLDFPGVIYGLPLGGMDGRTPYSKSVEEEAERSARLIHRVQPAGPYRLMGYSSGGCNTLETARVLRNAGHAIGFLGLLDTGLTDHHWSTRLWLSYMVPELAMAVTKRLKVALGRRVARSAPSPADIAVKDRPDILARRRGTRYEFRFRNPASPDYPHYTPYWRGDVTPRDGETRRNSLRMWGFYRPAPYDGHVSFFVAKGVNPISCYPNRYWHEYLGDIEWVWVPGNHITMMIGKYAAKLTAEVSVRLSPRAAPRHTPSPIDFT